MKIRKSYIATILIAAVIAITFLTMKISKESKETTCPAVPTDFAVVELTDPAATEIEFETQVTFEAAEETTEEPKETVQTVTHAETHEIIENEEPSVTTTTACEEEKTTSMECETSTEQISEQSAEPSTENSDISDECSEDDVYYLAAAIYREAGGESDYVQLLVANVIINRVNSAMYPNTIYGVLTQRGQYGMMWKYGVSFPSGADEATKTRCYDIARRILGGERVCPENVLFQAEFPQGSGVFAKVGNIYFCYY